MAEDIAYIITHTSKHTLRNSFDQKYSAPIIDNVLSGLWALRTNPNFYSYKTEEESTLAELIDFDIEGSELDKPHGFGFWKDDRDIYRKLAEPILVVPDVTDRFPKGLLTDIVRATKDRILLDGKLLDDETKIRAYLKRKSLDIEVEHLRRIYADKHTYAAFLIGYCFPKLGEAEKVIEEACPWSKKLKDPIGYIEALLERSL